MICFPTLRSLVSSVLNSNNSPLGIFCFLKNSEEDLVRFFEVFFEDDGRRLNVYIKHPKHEPRPIEMGSGAEKTIASMAIRLSLLHVSNLPTPNVFIMDEPGTALDAENMEGFVRILDMVKNYYKIVILISHVDALKDCVDHVINVEKEEGYAKVNV